MEASDDTLFTWHRRQIHGTSRLHERALRAAGTQEAEAEPSECEIAGSYTFNDFYRQAQKGSDTPYGPIDIQAPQHGLLLVSYMCTPRVGADADVIIRKWGHPAAFIILAQLATHSTSSIRRGRPRRAIGTILRRMGLPGFGQTPLRIPQGLRPQAKACINEVLSTWDTLAVIRRWYQRHIRLQEHPPEKWTRYINASVMSRDTVSGDYTHLTCQQIAEYVQGKGFKYIEHSWDIPEMETPKELVQHTLESIRVFSRAFHRLR